MPQPNSDGFAIGNAYSDSYGYGYGNAHSDGDANGHVYPDSNAYGYSYTDANGYGYGYVHTDGNSDSNSYGNSDLNAYSNCGEANTDAEAASDDTSTAPIVDSDKWTSSGGNSRVTLASSPLGRKISRHFFRKVSTPFRRFN